MLGAAVAVELYGISVYFVLYACEELEECTLDVHPHGHDFAVNVGEEFRCAVVSVLGKSCNGDVEFQLVMHHMAYHFHLPLASIGYHETWHLAPFVHQAAVAAVNHFGHRCVVVGAHHGLYVVFAVVGLRWFGFLEDHAAGHGVAALYV